MEITLQEWNAEFGATAADTGRYDELHRAAEEGTLVVIGQKGERLIPVRLGEFNWTLEPESK
jgi:hypothetical protein